MMPHDWRRSPIIPLCKNKGDVQDYNNFKGIKLLSHTMKLWEWVIEGRLRTDIRISENQFGFMPGRSTKEAIYLIRKLMEFYRDRKNGSMAFIDVEKDYNKVAREVLWRCLERKSGPVAYMQVIKDMYSGIRAKIRTLVG